MKKNYNKKTSVMEMKWFCESVRRCRTEKEMSQEELADKANLHRTYISQLENGKKNPSLTTICHLAWALEVEPWQLLYGCEVERKL